MSCTEVCLARQKGQTARRLPVALSSSVLHYRSSASEQVHRGSSALSCRLATRSHNWQLAKLSRAPARPSSEPGCTSNRLTRGIPQEELAAHQIQLGSELQCYQGSTKGTNYEGKSHSENISKSAPISTSVLCILQVRVGTNSLSGK